MARLNMGELLRRALPGELFDFCRSLGELAAPRPVYMVGGAVRDIILGRPPREADLVVEGSAPDLAQAAIEAGLAQRAAVSQFMTVRLSVGQHGVDLATARRESYTSPGALPTVAPADIETDLRRRDFTVNAVAVSLSGNDFGRVIDPHGGIADMRAGVLRALHPASFRDDATRLIRAARYAARLGFAPDVDTQEWLERDAPFIMTVGPDRLRNEFNRLWAEPEPPQALSLLRAWGVPVHIPGGAALSDLAGLGISSGQVAAVMDDGTDIADVYWALLAVTAAGKEDALIRAFNLSGRARRAIDGITQWNAATLAAVGAADGPRRVSRIVRALEGIPDCALAALQLTEQAEETIIVAYRREWRHIKPALNGTDLLNLGVPQGPAIGLYLDGLLDARLDGAVGDRSGEVSLIREWLARGADASPE